MKIIIVLALLLSGCVHVAYEPPLPMPPRPAWHFFLCGPENIWVCLTQPDANALNKYLDKLDAFEAGRQRVISGQEPPPK